MSDVKPLTDQPLDAGQKTPSTGPTGPQTASPAPINPLTHQPLDGAQSVTRKPRGRRAKPWERLLSPPVLATAGGLLLLGEVLLLVAVGPLPWAAINAAVGAVLVAVAVGWRSRRRRRGGRGGLLSWLRPARRGGRGGGGGGPRGGGGGGRGGRWRSLLGGGGRVRQRGGAAVGPSGGGRGGLLSRLRQAVNPRRRTATPGGGRGGPASRGGGGGGLLSRWRTRRRQTAGTGNTPGGVGGGRRRRQRGKRGSGGGGAVAAFMTGFRDATQRRTPPPGPKPAGKPTGKPTTPPAPPAAKPTTKPNTNPNPNPAPNNRPPSPAHRPAHTRKDPDMGIARNPDASLQRWGRDLASISPALDELAEGTGRTAETISGAAEAVKALAELGDSELPADRGLVAEAQAIYADLARIAAAQEALQAQLRQLSTRGDALAASYKRQHETDEARLSGERGGVAREKRADVSAAEQDT